MRCYKTTISTHLDNKIKVPFIIVERRRGITPNDLFPINLRHDTDVLSDGQSKRVIGVGETESVDCGVVRKSFFLYELERAPFDGVEYLTRDSWGLVRFFSLWSSP